MEIDRQDAERGEEDARDLPPVEKGNAGQLRFDAVVERHPDPGGIGDQQKQIDGMDFPARRLVLKHVSPFMSGFRRCSGSMTPPERFERRNAPCSVHFPAGGGTKSCPSSLFDASLGI